MTARAVVVGAGIAGLVAAHGLVGDDTGPGSGRGGFEVTVFDKGRSPGGRMATRRIGDATVDHGAQFFTARGPAFAARVERWRAASLVDVWCHGFDHEPDGHPRYVATAGMSSLAKDLAAGLDVRCDHLVFAVRRADDEQDDHRWRVVTDDGTEHPADAVVVTCPLPQTFSLLVESGVELPAALFGGGSGGGAATADGDVDHRDYDRTLALLVVLDGPSAVPPPGGLQAHQLANTPWSFVGDNHAKGISGVPAVTFHAGPEWSEIHWDDPADELHQRLLDAAAPFVGDRRVVESQVKRWRFATPRARWPEPCWADPSGTLVLAGDAFRGPKIEAAHDSGQAAAAHLRRVLDPLSR
ncbi:MAG: FAD-dependent oxidoreductase [Ilumatobacteraceae bacterium]